MNFQFGIFMPANAHAATESIFFVWIIEYRMGWPQTALGHINMQYMYECDLYVFPMQLEPKMKSQTKKKSSLNTKWRANSSSNIKQEICSTKKLQNILHINKTKGNNDGEINKRKKGDTWLSVWMWEQKKYLQTNARRSERESHKRKRNGTEQNEVSLQPKKKNVEN